ncbi:chloride channel protein [Streptomyces sp. NPDC059650]|uniref:chloride channel protein n=1 Tax=Streptomyces sp. NPDC059650 TaxID=3346896 RepID=UPI0036951852
MTPSDHPAPPPSPHPPPPPSVATAPGLQSDPHVSPADAEPVLRAIILSRGYARLMLLSVLIGVPVAAACFFFVGFQHYLQHLLWESLPQTLGFGRAPWWWPLPTLLLAGLIAAPIITRMPGSGGHVPVNGLRGAPMGPRELPGVVLSALTVLPLGASLGPEAPLMALGSGLALLWLHAAKRPVEPKIQAIVATTGSTAAISTILGGPIVAALMVVEAAGLAGPQLVVLLLPCLVASAAGAVVFTSLGAWTGLPVGGLTLPQVPPDARPDAGDFLWGIPVAIAVALVVSVAHEFGRPVLAWTKQHTARKTVLAALAVGVCFTAYALTTGRSPEEAALSGQITLGELAGNYAAWPVGALLALVLFKGLAWGICLGALRGGPIFPAVLMGAALAIACSGLPGFGAAPALGVGIAAATAVVSGLPLTSAVLGALLLGPDASNQVPLIVIASVVAFITSRFVVYRRRPPGPVLAHPEST